MPFGLLKARAEDLAKVLSWVSLEMARCAAKNDDSLPAVDSLNLDSLSHDQPGSQSAPAGSVSSSRANSTTSSHLTHLALSLPAAVNRPPQLGQG